MIIIRKRNKFTVMMLLLFMLLFGSAIQSSAATNVVTTAKTVSGGTWVKSGGNVKYRYSNGKYATNAWIKVGGNLYYMNASSNRVKGWFTYNKQKYYADSNGIVFVSKLLSKSGAKYYLQANGVMAAGKFVKIGGKYYFFDNNGKMLKNKLVYSGKKYYYVNSSGARITSTWLKKSGKKYYFDENGVRVSKKWVKKNNKYYYLQDNGTMAINKWVGNYYVDGTGARKTDCVINGYYLDSTGKKVIKVFKGKYIFLGDSRTVGMGNSVKRSDTEYIGKIGEGYKWLKETGGVTLSYYLKTNPNVTVILGLGINDPGNIGSYITYYKNLVSKYPKTKFWFMSINPADEKVAAEHHMTAKESVIKSFNAKLKEAFGGRYIDSYSYLKKEGYTAADGVHYDAATYQKLYQFVIGKISK